MQNETLISKIANENNCVVLCLQETHRSEQSNNIFIEGFKLVAQTKHVKYGSTLLMKNN